MKMKKMLKKIIVIYFIALNTIFAEKILLTSGEWGPYMSNRLYHGGFVTDVIINAFKAVNVDVEIEYYPWGRSYAYAKEGEVNKKNYNGTLVWIYTPERAEYFYYSDIVLSENVVLFYLKENDYEFEKIEDLKGLRIGGTLHTVYPVLEQAEKEGIIKIIRDDYYENLFRKLLTKRVDAIPYLKNVGLFYIRNSLIENDRKKIIYSKNSISIKEYHLILNRKDSNNLKLIKKFNEELKIIKENGVYEKLKKDFENGKYLEYIK
jgi:polar amino acid transport system substrate-binding protein